MSAPAPPVPGLDEMVDGTGRLRSHWRGVLEAFMALGDGGLAERARRLDRAFWRKASPASCRARRDGPGAATRCRCRCRRAEFAAAGSWAGAARPSARPAAGGHLRSAGRGRRGRAAAGPGVRQPRVPAPVPVRPERPPLLHSYAADLIRGPDGAWRVLADRTDRRRRGRLCAREPAPAVARAARGVSARCSCASCGRSSTSGRIRCAGWPQPGRPNPTVALLTPGTTVAALVRAHVPGARIVLRAGRRRRPDACAAGRYSSRP